MYFYQLKFSQSLPLGGRWIRRRRRRRELKRSSFVSIETFVRKRKIGGTPSVTAKPCQLPPLREPLAALLHRSAGKVFFCQAFLFAKKRLRSKYSVKQFFTLSGQTGGLVSSGVSAVRGSAPDVSFAKLFFLQRKAGYLTISLAAAAYLAIFASTSSLFAPFAMI